MKILALDIGGTAVKYGYFGEDTVFGVFPVKDADGNERLPQKLLELISKFDAECIGISVPGPFDYDLGISLMEHKLKSLYKINLKEMIQKQFPQRKIFFIHDATSFIFGAMSEIPSSEHTNVSGVMLGTGLGYVHFVDGRVEVNPRKTPLKSLWSKPYKEGVAENYVCATAIVNKAKAAGYSFDGVKEIAEEARRGNSELTDIFFETGMQMGELVSLKREEDGFERLIIGGQASGAWDLMKRGFESTCSIPYCLVEDPAKCPLFGIKYCAEKGLDAIYMEGEV